MSDLSRFEQLVAAAQGDGPPKVDVSAEVLSSIRVVRARRSVGTDRAALAFAAASVLAASVMALVAWYAIEEPMLAEVPNPFVVPVMGSR